MRSSTSPAPCTAWCSMAAYATCRPRARWAHALPTIAQIDRLDLTGAAALAAHGIGSRIVPGITAGIGGLAYAGIPVTSRDTNHAVIFLTGHDETGGIPASVDWAAIATAAPVIVMYMAAKHLVKLDELRQLKAEHLGVVLNGVRATGGGYYGRNIKTYYEYQNGATAA